MNRSLAVSVAALVLLAACGGKPPAESTQAPAPAAAPAAEPPAPVTVEDIVEKSAIVEAIDLEKRLVTLKSDDGEVATIQVSEEVRNLPQVKVGDRVVARYYEAIGARVTAPTAAGSPTVELATGRAPEGAAPSAAIGQQVTLPVTIIAVKNDGKLVSFYGADGLVRVMEVQRPEGQEFARGLKEGDKVELTYTEAVGISVEPVAATPSAPQG